MKKDSAISTCCCATPIKKASDSMTPNKKIKRSTKTILSSIYSVGLSLLIGLFPKCPVCWAAYLSIFGSYSLSKLPFMPWLMPVFVGFLGIHLYLVYRNIKNRGIGPFATSVLGAGIILAGKMLFEGNTAFMITGMVCILAGSLWNSFSLQSKKIIGLH
ncbi:hypothetical protein N7U66_00250 [Lacinutrix neustonica]|uniref:MerC domain-containing protein n=1 Tax=Lacinutrix neustonica TaxID=2980107 RepID=A0A9E8SDZ0_9FLAO|nr:hypothetical protein [Lacinutrix neustonica]WAC02252.1 hypothetical protein N7U66_00250 [Lacinutrix neustonica]